ncbi:hypothetical protein BU23DRAFT_517392, partial [Bimuria novae-zelandiae CBS 107.79]
MTGKRKRGKATANGPESAAPPNGTAKPMSAIAAARLRAAAAIPNNGGLQEAPASSLTESSASEAAKSESEPEDVLPVHQNFKLSTWRKHQSNVLSDTSKELSIVLDKNATASFVGCFDVKVLKGAVNINGANLGATTRGSKEEGKSHRVFVPSTHPITKIRGLDRTNHIQLRSCREPVPFADLSPLFSDIWSGSAERDKGRTFAYVTESDDDPLQRPLVPEHAPEDWIRTMDDISATASATLIIGPSVSGKSTFLKRLLNRYLTGFGKTAKPVPAVCYLDLDHSNPEYTPHGQPSLTIVRELNLGPTFTHPATIPGHSDANETIISHVLPVQGLTNYEEYFNSCVKSFFQTYQNLRLDGPTPPLLINTSGDLYNAHFHLLEKMIKTTKPNHILYLGNNSSISEATAYKLDTLQTFSQKTHSKLHELTAQFPALPPPRTPADLRAMQMQSYFHLTARAPSSHPIFTSSPLTTLSPWEFHYKGTLTRTQDLLGILSLSDPLPPSHLLTALNGSVIHIVSTTDTTLTSQSASLPRTPKSLVPYFPADTGTGMAPAPRPECTTYVCTALLCGIDPETHTLQLLVPTTHERLLEGLEPEKTVLVAGCCDTPEWAYMEDAYAQVAQRRRELGERARFASNEMV